MFNDVSVNLFFLASSCYLFEELYRGNCIGNFHRYVQTGVVFTINKMLIGL